MILQFNKEAMEQNMQSIVDYYAGIGKADTADIVTLEAIQYVSALV
jgi:hypothetical protein